MNIANAPHPCLAKELAFPWDRYLYASSSYGHNESPVNASKYIPWFFRNYEARDISKESPTLAPIISSHLKKFSELPVSVREFSSDWLPDYVAAEAQAIADTLRTQSPDFNKVDSCLKNIEQARRRATAELRFAEADGWLPAENDPPPFSETPEGIAWTVKEENKRKPRVYRGSDHKKAVVKVAGVSRTVGTYSTAAERDAAKAAATRLHQKTGETDRKPLSFAARQAVAFCNFAHMIEAGAARQGTARQGTADRGRRGMA